jgi:hypothetical protein
MAIEKNKPIKIALKSLDTVFFKATFGCREAAKSHHRVG